ncbi:3-oxo-5-alpha-steroid 4-dehydrogenase-domain-containing protein [Gymnopilus junonius]|uniref:3-oxo-5-alpha-steroid 4-dehydrogenase-domain-containing protein n=1 Tax=Gymnopilus junonius TaxID=109634 RepID=A0A9P5NR61_GYMJU|nr:3-oxo-5-alpha-steroid 4-dehydrogenase-domain-containing protein [Gymnopilus junonius]
MVQLTISTASKPPAFARGLPVTIDIATDATVGEVKRAVQGKFPKFSSTRQRITLKGERKPLENEIKLSDVLDQKAGAWELQVKDLGPQISWKTVFLVEYFGPLLIHPLFYHFPRFWYGTDVQHSALQKYVYAFVLLHFVKRELETLYVHRFSHDTMPWINIFRNSAHYWIFGGVLVALDVYRPKYSATSPFIVNTIRDNERFLWIGAGLWAFAELSNLHTHLAFRALRPAGTRKRGIPRGYGFSLVSSPNYFFEILGWAIICGMTGSIGALIFTVFGTVTMGQWAAKKHRNYKKEFGKEYPSGRKAMIPFIF